MIQRSSQPAGHHNGSDHQDNGDKWFWLFVIVATICWAIQQILK